MVILSSFESVVSKLEKRSKNRASKKFVFDTRATAKERITRISSNNYNFLIFLSFAFGKDEVGSSNLPSSSIETRCPARDSGFLLFSVGKFAYAKPIQKPIPIKLAQLQFLLMESKMGTAQQAPICLQ